MLLSCDVLFFEDQFMETDDRHAGGCINRVGCDCISNREDSNEEEESG